MARKPYVRPAVLFFLNLVCIVSVVLFLSIRSQMSNKPAVVVLEVHNAARVEEVEVIAAVQPVPRALVNDLTEDLLAIIHQYHVGRMWVVGPAVDINLQWSAIQPQCEVNFVESIQNLSSVTTGGAVGGGPGALRSVVVVIKDDNDGTVQRGMRQFSTSITAMMGPLHVATFVYSTHAGRGGLLVGYNRLGSPFRASFQSTSSFRETFNRIYRHQIWSSAGGGSGVGSSLESTQVVRETLPSLVQRYGIKSMLDSSCGSMHWMPLALTNITHSLPDFRFMGTDLVCDLMEQHWGTFKEHKNWQFACVDYANERLPAGYELVFSRDSLQHLPLDSVWMFLNNVKASGARYLLVGSYIGGATSNRDIAAGDYYPIDLTKAPFNVQQPKEIIDEGVVDPITGDRKHLLLYEVATMTWLDPLLSVSEGGNEQ